MNKMLEILRDNGSENSGTVGIVLAFINEHWPVVWSQVPEHVAPVCRRDSEKTSLEMSNLRGFGCSDGVSSHPDVADDSWVQSRGFAQFALKTEVPEAFFWMGVQDGGGSEYFFLMWCRNGRRFWFYDQYVVFYEGEEIILEKDGMCFAKEASNCASKEQTLKHLDSALDQWASTTSDVIYSGPCGGFGPSIPNSERWGLNLSR